MTLLAFLLALGVLITVHEWGHYRVAVACGVKVVTFAVGFGKPLIKWRARHPHPGQNTEFVIGFIPLGGYVKMLGEQGDDPSEVQSAAAFTQQPLWARALIVAAGPLANLLLAVCLYAATYWIGQYETQATLSAPVVGSVADAAGLRSGDTVVRMGTQSDSLEDVSSLEALRWWLVQHDDVAVYLEVETAGRASTRLLHMPEVTNSGDSEQVDAWQVRGLTSAWSRPVIGEVQTGLPASAAGLQRGDVVRRIDGQWIQDASMLRLVVRASGAQQEPDSQVWEVLRNGQLLQLNVTPELIKDGSHRMGRIGAQVGEAPAKVFVQSGVWDGLFRAMLQTWDVCKMTLTMLGRLLTGQASLDNLSGPLTMADYAGRSASLGLGAYLSYLALVSVSLGVFNLLPLPVLDGGHLLYYLYEACTGRPPSPEWRDVMQRVGLTLVVALMLFSIFNDVVHLGWLS